MSAEKEELSPGEELLQKLRGIDPDILVEVVRQDQSSPSFDIFDWSVRRLSGKGLANPDGLFLFHGYGQDERSTRPWSVVLKIARDPGGEENSQDIFYWKREILLAQSGMLETLPDGVLGPRFYGVTEDATGGWIWMEYIRDACNGPWTRDNYAFAARQIGRYTGAFLTGAPLPDYPWLARDHVRGWLGAFNPEGTWGNPYVQKFFSADVRRRVKDYWEDRECLLGVLDRLPQIFSHFDLSRRNLFIRKPEGRPDELVAIDWALCGYGSAGADLFSLIGITAMYFEIEPASISKLDQIAFRSYLGGLREAGWGGNPDLLRLSLCIWYALCYGVGMPGFTALTTSRDRSILLQQYDNRSPETIASGFATICEFSLDRGDEARLLIDRLGL